MKRSGYTGYVEDVDGSGVYLFVPGVDVRELQKQEITQCTVWLDDGRTISAAQRNKIFALVSDITEWVSGFDKRRMAYNETLRELQLNYLISISPETVRRQLTLHYCALSNIDFFSLSGRAENAVDMTTARDFIDWLVELCVVNGIPCQDTLLNRCEDIGRYLYACLTHKRCCLCGKKSDLHHVDAVGMGRDRKTIIHLGLRVLPLCRCHHNEAHGMGDTTFCEKYHLEPIRLNEELCRLYRLRYE